MTQLRKATVEGLVQKQLDRIERLAKQKEEELERAQYEKYHELFELAIRAIRRERVMMYGGTALNDLLPPRLRFYPATKLPDIDVFAVGAEKVAKRVVATFARHGYKVASYAPALHPGTFKVFLNGLQVLDITDLPERTFRHLVRGAVSGPTGIRIADPEYLRMTLHAMLAQSNDAYRWAKNFERMAAFYQAFPPPRAPAKAAAKAAAATRPRRQLIPEALREAAQALFVGSEHVVFGADEAKGVLYVLAREDVAATAQRFIDRLVALGAAPAESLAVSAVYAADNIVPDHAFVTYKGHRLLGVYLATSCMSYLLATTGPMAGIRMASIHTRIALYLMMSLSVYDHTDRAMLRAVADGATRTLLDDLRHPGRKKQLQQFVLECYGQHTGVVTLRREALLRRYGKKI